MPASEAARTRRNAPTIPIWRHGTPCRRRDRNSSARSFPKITRRISIDRFRRDHRTKRGGAGALTAELTDCLPDPAEPTPAEAYDAARTRDAINRFLAGLPSDRRTLFVNRYFFGVSVAALAASSGLSQANVKVILHRMRGELKKRLEEEEIPL